MRAKRVDKNQKEIVGVFRELGWSVAHTHMVGCDFPDLVVAKHGFTILIEIKDEKGKASKGQLNFLKEWDGFCMIVRNLDDVIKINKVIDSNAVLFHFESQAIYSELNN